MKSTKKERKPAGFWTKKRVIDDAKKYHTVKDWRKNSGSPFNVARKEGYLKEATKHMAPLQNPKNFWTKERVIKDAKKYKTIREWRKNSKTAYFVSLQNNYHPLATRHMIKLQKKSGYWTREKILKNAKKFKTISEWRKSSGSAANAAKRLGCYDEAIAHMELLYLPDNHWTKEKATVEAKKFQTRTDFRKEGKGAYTTALKNGWLEEICSHMRVCGNKHQRAIYVFEFPDKSAYIGLSQDPIKRRDNHLRSDTPLARKAKTMSYVFKQITSFVSREEAAKLEGHYLEEYRKNGWCIINRAKAGALGGNLLLWTREALLTEALKYNTKDEFSKMSSGAYQAARQRDDFEEICCHMSQGRKPNGYWTKENCKREAFKFKTRSDFSRGCSSGYIIARKKGWLDEICSHMEERKKPNGYWTEKRCAHEASKYKTRLEFQKNNPGAYDAAKKKGWVSKVCEHMEFINRPNGFWEYERCAKEALKYKTRSEFRMKCSGDYQKAQRKKWLNKICKHMKNYIL